MARGMLSFDELKRDVEEQQRRRRQRSENGNGNNIGSRLLDVAPELDDEERFDTVIVAGIDMQGRLIGKHMTAEFFVDEGHERSMLCEGLLFDDIECTPHPEWHKDFNVGYPDFALKPDLQTLRNMPWREKTAICLCDIKTKSGIDYPYSPRAILKQQIERLKSRGLKAMMATELEFYIFRESYESAQSKQFINLKGGTNINHPDMVLHPSREEKLMRALRNGLQGAGIPVENSIGEYGPNQVEINVRYTDALEMADRHALMKHFCHEITHKQDRSLTFMAKYGTNLPGSSSHIHCSLWSLDGRTPLFYDPNDELGMSKVMRQFVAGLLKYAPDCTYFFAPYINSYKRLIASGTFSPTKLCWALDNRTSAFRVSGEQSTGIRVECRIGGADLNPYLAFAGMIAAGLAGLDESLFDIIELELEAPIKGNVYDDGAALPEVPKTLRESIEHLSKSEMLKKALGEQVLQHYIEAGRVEQESFDRQVTDWERMRYFERC